VLAQIFSLRPKPADWLFSVKTFAAAILALLLALALQLDRPAWAMATVYIVAQPLSGALASKAAYRVLGTAIGALVSLLLVPPLVPAPPLLVLALALWVGFCLAVARLDRTPRSYVFMLAGYTAALISFPCVTQPQALFDTALARVEEITLGILCATLVSHIVFPRHVGPVIAARIDGWMADVRALAHLSFDPLADAGALHRERARLAADLGDLHGFAVHLGYERSALKDMTRPLQALQSAMAGLLPVLYGVQDRLAALAETPGGVPAPVRDLLQPLQQWTPEQGECAAWCRRIAALREIDCGDEWSRLLLLNLCTRLQRYVEISDDCYRLWCGIRARRAPRDLVARWCEASGNSALHRDRGVALRSGVAAALAIVATSSFWIATAWPYGGIATMMTAVAACIMSFLDDPVPALKQAVASQALSSLAVIGYLYGVLPGIDGFSLLVLVLAPVLIPLGVLLTAPQTYGIGLPMLANLVMLLNFQERFSSQFADTLDGVIAMLSGFVVAAVVTALVRSLSGEASLRRLLAANWRDLAAAARATRPQPRLLLLRRMLDRLGLILPRLAAIPEHRALLARVVPESAIGVSILELRRLQRRLAPVPAAELEALLRALQHYFAGCAGLVRAQPDSALAQRIDGLLAGLREQPDAALRDELQVALVTLRRSLCGGVSSLPPTPAATAAANSLGEIA